MTFKPVGVDENGKFPQRVQATLNATYEPKGAASAAAAGKMDAPLDGALSILRAAIATRNVAPVPIVFAGSSSIAGTGASTPSKNFVSLVMSGLQSAFPASSGAALPLKYEADMVTSPALSNGLQGFNTGRPGSQSNWYIDGTNRSKITALQPRAIFHMVGSNDWQGARGAADYKGQLLSQIAQLDAAITGPHVHVLVHQYQRMDVSMAEAWSDYGKAMKEIAAASPDKIAFWDVSKDFQLIGIPGTDPLDIIGTDNIHMTDAGHEFMATLWLSKLGVQRVLPAAAPAGTVITSDTFLGGDAATLANRSTDAANGGPSVPWQFTVADAWAITSGALVPGTSALSFMGAQNTLPGGIEVSVKVNSSTGAGDLWLVAQRDVLSGPANQIRASIKGGVAQLYKMVGGTGAFIGAQVPYAAGQTVAVSVSGDQVRLKIDGITKETQTVAPMSAPFYGLARATDTVFSVDNFLAKTV